jgi:nucleoside triphosphate pyrophosphatase
MNTNGTRPLILATASPIRATLLRNAGLVFDTKRAEIDERAVETPLLEARVEPAGIAEILAQAKAGEVADKHRHACVVGCDQTLSLDGELMHKPADMEAARRRLLQLSGRTHQLNTAACIRSGEELVWSAVETNHITFRVLDPGFVGRHLAGVGTAALESVGAYQFEGAGIQLVETYQGDYFSILGLPLLPLIAVLRDLGFPEA